MFHIMRLYSTLHSKTAESLRPDSVHAQVALSKHALAYSNLEIMY